MQIVLKPISEIKNYAKNARTHSEQQVTELAESIKSFGFLDPIEISADNIIISGHARLAAAIQLGLTHVPTITHAHLEENARKAYILATNRIAQSAGWDTGLLKEELTFLNEDGFDLALTGFTGDEIAAYLMDTPPAPEADPEFEPEPQEDAITRKGDVWILGKHRVMCGDVINLSDIDLLMANEKADMVFTDPPYNTGMTAKSQKGHLSHMFDDSFEPDEWEYFLQSFMTSYWSLMKDDSVAYICLDWRRNHELVPAIEGAGFKRSNLIIWDKMVHGLGSDYKYTHEFINVCKKGKPRLVTNQGDDREYYDVWHIQRKIGKSEDHATKKPIELMERAIRHASKVGQLVVDLFGGSGSTLIACEKNARRCYTLEISERYCNVIVRRWQQYTGKKAILESTGDAFPNA